MSNSAKRHCLHAPCECFIFAWLWSNAFTTRQWWNKQNQRHRCVCNGTHTHFAQVILHICKFRPFLSCTWAKLCNTMPPRISTLTALFVCASARTRKYACKSMQETNKRLRLCTNAYLTLSVNGPLTITTVVKPLKTSIQHSAKRATIALPATRASLSS